MPLIFLPDLILKVISVPQSINLVTLKLECRQQYESRVPLSCNSTEDSLSAESQLVMSFH